MSDRATIIDQYKQNPDIPVLIIGAGINGVGTYRDLAAQGVNALIVDKNDFCSGASSASSHMLHGGIRYLENGEFRLVREALTERNLMLRNAPHYAKPMPTTVPIFKWFSGLLNAPLKFVGLMDKPSERGALVIKIGMTVYDIFARNFRVMPKHTFMARGKSLKKYPKLNPEIKFTGTYYDSWMPSPERICMDLIRDTSVMDGNANALNYVSAVDASGDTVTLKDEITGETFDVKPQIVINAGGPWIDFVNKAMDVDTRFIGGTKGTHLILDNPDLYEALNGHEFFFENHDGRIVLLMPYMGKVMAGTTDIRIEDPDKAIAEKEEIDYILNMVPKVFPSIPVSQDQVVFLFCGVRPLAASEAGYTGNVTRDHQIKTVAPGKSGYTFPIYSLVGGKWTSFRAFSEETADVALKDLKQPRVVSTQHMAIGGGHAYPKNDTDADLWVKKVSERTNVDADRVRELFDRYGTHAEAICQFIAEGKDKPLDNHAGYSEREMIYLIQSEQVTRLPDIFLRRTLIAWLGELNEALLEEVATLTAKELGWSDQRRDEEIEYTVNLLNERYGGRLQVVEKAI